MPNESIRLTPAAPFVGIGNSTVINIEQIVWLKTESDGTVTVGLSAPGPDGKNVVKVPAGASAEGLIRYVCDPSAKSR